MNKKVLCFGDSITEGKPGITYVKYLKGKGKFINYGLGGDTLIGVRGRLEKTLKKKKYDDVTDIVVGIGANDILQGTLKDYSKLWDYRVRLLIKRGSVACENGEEFIVEYEKMLEFLSKTNKKIIVFSMPYIENTEFNFNEIIEKYNAKIKVLCQKYKIEFIDYWSWQYSEKKSMNNTGVGFMPKNPLLVGVDTFLTTYLPLSNFISRKRGLALTVDGCHSNKHAAKNLARLIEEKLEN